MRITPLRVALAVLAVGLVVMASSFAVAPAPEPDPEATPEVRAPSALPRPDDEPDVVEGAPGSRQQLLLFGGLLVALGAVGALATAQAAGRSGTRRAMRATER